MYRMSVMAMLVQGSPYDYTHCVKLAIVHDMAECRNTCLLFVLPYTVFFCSLHRAYLSIKPLDHNYIGIVGDITPHCGVSDKEKFAKEAEAVAHLKIALGDCLAAEEIEKLWYEYEEGETNEAKLVKDFDKVRIEFLNDEVRAVVTDGILEGFVLISVQVPDHQCAD